VFPSIWQTSSETYNNNPSVPSITRYDISFTLAGAPASTNVTCGMISSNSPKLTSTAAGGWGVQPSAAASILNGVSSASCGNDALDACVDALEAYGSVTTDANGDGVIFMGNWSRVRTVVAPARTGCG
jgi:hypothetical protein